MKTPPTTTTTTAAAAATADPVEVIPAEHREDFPRGLAFMIASLACFTANTLLIKHLAAGQQINLWLMLFFRSLVGFVITLAMFRNQGAIRFGPMFREPLLVARGLLGIVGTAAYYYTIPALGAGKATLIGSTYILFAALLAFFILREHLTRARAAWMGLAFLGLALLTGTRGASNGTAAHTALFGLAEFVALLGAVTAAGAVIAIRRLTRRHTSATIYMCQCVYLLAAFTPVVFFVYQWPGALNAALIVAGAVFASLGQLAMNEGYRHLPVATGASIQMALPVTATLGGILIFHESFNLPQAAGAALIVLGTYRVVVARKPRPGS